MKSDHSMTWQQREAFGAKPIPHRRRGRRVRKVPKLLPLDLEAVATQPEITATDRRQTEQQREAPVDDPRLEARGKAATGVLPYRAKQFTPCNPVPLPQGHDSISKKPCIDCKKQPKGMALVGNTVTNMTAKLEGPYLPPHMRKRAAAPFQSNNNIQLGDSIGVGSPPASVKSQGAKPVQDKVLPDEVVAQENAPPSPPMTAEKVPRSAEQWSGREEHVIEQPPTPAKRRQKPRWSRAPRAAKERCVWPKAREIPKALSSGSASDGGVNVQSNSEGDPSYDVKKLIAWNGDWLPPPEEWAARKGFTHRHFGQVIEQWANEHSENCTRPMKIDVPAFSGQENVGRKQTTKELVPRYWLHETIDNDSPRKFWEQLPHRAPAALSDIDTMEDPPYWERWEDDHPDHCFMDALVVPEARIDDKDPENELKSPFALLCTTERLARIKNIKDSKARREHARRNKPIHKSTQEMSNVTDRRLQSKANIYLRPVQPADVVGITAIYNHYVTSTVHACELEERTEAMIRCRINDIVLAGLPFLVAVAKRNQRKGPQGYVNETVVGYVYLEDYVGQSSMYRYTFDLELYVHPGYIRQGIGKCLLDRLMYIANTGYNARGGYEWVNDFEYLKNGKSRVIKTIVAALHYERGDEVEWATSYLGEFGFKKAGRFAQIGYKNGKIVDKVMFQLQTTEVIDPKSVPVVRR